MVETLLMRCVARAREWHFNLWPAGVCLFHFSCSLQPPSHCFAEVGSRLMGSVRQRRGVQPPLRQLGRPETGLAPSLRMNLGQRATDVRQLASTGLIFLIITGTICKTTCAGTGTSAGGLHLPGNRPLRCGFGLTSGRWLCGLRLHTLRQQAHPSGAWMGHPLARVLTRLPLPGRVPAFGCRLVRLRLPPMLLGTGCRITTGCRGGLPRC
jgi:hypothetical protein